MPSLTSKCPPKHDICRMFHSFYQVLWSVWRTKFLTLGIQRSPDFLLASLMHLNVDSSDHITPRHCSLVQSLCLLANASLFCTCFSVRSGFFLALLVRNLRRRTALSCMVRILTRLNRSGYSHLSFLMLFLGDLSNARDMTRSAWSLIFLGLPGE